MMSDIVPRPEMPPTYHRLNDRGLIEVVDMNTGRILCVQHSHENLLATKWDRLTRIDTPEGPVFIEKGLNFDVVGRLREFPFSQVLADLLVQHVANGATLLKACKDMNLEYSVVKKWQRENEAFKESIAQAEKDFADFMRDEVINEARSSKDSKTKIAALQWGAEKGNPDKYGNKIKHSGDANAPVTFVLSTGINRTPSSPEGSGTREVTPQGPSTEIAEPDFGGDDV